MSKIGIGDLRQMMREVMAEALGTAVGGSPFTPVRANGSSVGAPLTVTLDTEGKPWVEYYVSTSGATTFFIEGSLDNITWYLCDSMVFLGAGNDHDGSINAWRYLRIRCPDALDLVIDIGATR